MTFPAPPAKEKAKTKKIFLLVALFSIILVSGLILIKEITNKPDTNLQTQEVTDNQEPTEKIAATTEPKTSSPKYSLRQTPRDDLSINEVKEMLKKYDFHCKTNEWSKEWANQQGKGIYNQYKEKAINGNKIIIDYATGLTWQQSGSDNYMIYQRIQAYLNNLNKSQFAGFNDWRLPTLEEAMSLMEPQKSDNGLHINPLFDKTKLIIWTADLSKASSAWAVDFYFGWCSGDNGFTAVSHKVRAVRSGH